MDLTPENKVHIDSLSYEQLLSKWRFAPVGDPWFQGETGTYLVERMKELKKNGANHIQASKNIGWNK